MTTTTPVGGWTPLNAFEGAPKGRVGWTAEWSNRNAGLVLFGGLASPDGVMDGTWLWDGSSWAQAEPAQSPPARERCSLSRCDDLGNLLLFAGLGPEPDDPTEPGSARAWVWDGADWSLSGAGPPRRMDASMTLDEANQVVTLFGGLSTLSPATFLGDTWSWLDGQWEQQAPVTSPSARIGGAITFDRTIGQVLLFGGGAGPLLDDTWAWDGGIWRPIQTEHSPPARQFAGMVYHPGLGGTILFGGIGLGRPGTPPPLDDTWLFDGRDWSQVQTPQVPPAGDGRGLVYSPALEAALLLTVTGGKGQPTTSGQSTVSPYQFSGWTL